MELKINVKGQVTIPSDLRNQYGFTHNVKVKFYAGSKGELYLVKAEDEKDRLDSVLTKMRGYCRVDVSTQEVLAVTRDYEI